MNALGQIPYPAELGEWSRQKDGLFKAKMNMDSGDFKALQMTVRKVAHSKFDRKKTARSQPKEVLEAISSEVFESHKYLLKNRLAYDKRKESIQSQKEQTLATNTRSSISGRIVDLSESSSTFSMPDGYINELILRPSSQFPQLPILAWNDETDLDPDGFLKQVQAAASLLCCDSKNLSSMRTAFHETLCWALQEDNVAVVYMLYIKFGADVNEKLACGGRPLSVTIQYDSLKCFRLLLLMKSNAFIADETHGTPLFLALSLKREAAAKILVQRGARCSIDDFLRLSDCRAADIARESQSGLQMVAGEVIHGLDLESGVSALCILFAAIYQDLCRVSDNPDDADEISMIPPPLHAAAMFGSLDLVQRFTLLDINTSISWSGISIAPPRHALFIALYWERYELAKFLFQQQTVLHCSYEELRAASKAGFHDIVQAMIGNGMNVNPSPNSQTKSALHTAVAWGRADVAHLLIYHGAWCTYDDLIAALRSRLPDVALVICGHMKHTMRDIRGYPNKSSDPFRGHSVQEGSSSSSLDVGFRLEYLNRDNDRGKKDVSALHLAVKEGYTDTVRWLLEYGARYNPNFTEDLRSALHLALSTQHVDIALLLIESGADISELTPDQRSHISATQGILALLNGSPAGGLPHSG